MLLLALALAGALMDVCSSPEACAPAIGVDASTPANPLDGEILQLLETASASMAGNDGDFSGADLYGKLGETRRNEVRCATLALFATEAGQGWNLSRSHGLTPAKAGVLAGRLVETLIEETGEADGEVRALFSTDLYEFTEQVRPARDPAVALGAALDQCRPLYATVTLDGGDGVVSGLAPAAILIDPGYPNPVACYALLAGFASSMPPGSGERRAFESAARQIEAAWLADPAADSDAADDLAIAAANFDGEAFSALPEEKAETRMLYCMKLGGME